MKTKEKRSTPLWHYIWSSYIRSALLPLVLIELLLVFSFLMTNSFVARENMKTVHKLVQEQLGVLVQQESRQVEQKLHSVEQLTELFRQQTERAYRRPFIPEEGELARYTTTDKGTWLTVVDSGGSAAYYSSLSKAGEKEKQKALQLSQLDPLMKDIHQSNSLVAQIYLNTHDSLNRIYPYLNPLTTFEEDIRIPDYNFYYDADSTHNPERKTVWTEVYKDPAGQGWITSCIAPVYVDDFLEAVVGLDVTVKTIIDNIVNISIPWGGSVFLLDQKGTIMAMSTEGKQLLGLKVLTDTQYDGIVKQDTFKPEQYNIRNHSVFENIASQLLETAHGVSPFLSSDETQISGWGTIEQTGWKLLVMVPEKNILAVADKLEDRIQKISWMLIVGVTLFTLLFLLSLYYRTRKTSFAIAKHIDAIDAFQVLFQKSSDGILLIEGGQIVDCNEAVLSMLNYPNKDDLLHKHPAGVSPELQPDGQSSYVKAEELLKVCLENGYNRFEWMHQKADGEIFWVEVVLTRLEMKGKTVIHVACRNISEKKEYEKKLEEKNSELALMLKKVRVSQQESEHAIRARSTFLANMSHEIRTPMNAIMGMTRLALDTKLDLEQQKYLYIVNDAATSLLGLLNDILDFSKIDAGQLVLEESTFDLRELVENAAQTMALKAHEKGIEIFCHVEDGINTALIGDQLRLRQILLNLVGNAVKFTTAGEVVIRVGILEKKDPKHGQISLCFSVSDTGPGIAKEKQDEIFNTFSQADNSVSRLHGGTGLGLTISKQLVELMGGEIWVESEPGSGAVFHFTVCCKQAELRVQKLQFPLEPAEYKVLIVDDKETNRYIVKEMLRSWNFPVSEAASGEEGLREILRAHKYGTPYRLLILDQKMRSMTGLELVDKLTAELDSVLAPFLLLSSSADHDVAKRCRAIEECTLLLKPVRRSDLFDTISSLLAAVEPSGVPEVPGLETIPDKQSGKNLEILLAEDNEANRELATILLERDGDKVTAAVNGVEALELLSKQHFDIIFMDVQMPEMDGLATTRCIRGCENGGVSPQHPEYASLLLALARRLKGQHIPIIAITAHAMTGDRQSCFNAGADDYLTKPFLPDAIEAVLLKYK